MKLSLISEHAKRDPEFQCTSLAHLLNKEFLKDCYNSLNRNKAVGVDGVSWKEYGENLDENVEALVSRMKRKKFKPQPARRVYIPKNENESRPLGIPALENRIVEYGITRILESVYEADFLDCSFGFRPKRNCHQAIGRLDKLIRTRPVNYVVEADIKGFFDNVPHKGMMKFLMIRIKDTTLLNLIERFLKAGYVDNGLLTRSEKGTPQGSIISPMLANIFLHYVLDKWFDTTVKSHLGGFCELVRYADDFICVVQYADEAAKVERALKNRFKKYGLEIHPDKSKTIGFGRFERKKAERQNRKPPTFTFLGFTHFCDTTRKGKFKVGHKTDRKKFRAKCKEMNVWLKAMRNLVKTKDWWKTLQAKLRGHYQYYGVSGNSPAISSYYCVTICLVRKWLNRRSQKKKMSWIEFKRYLAKYPLPKPKIMHNLYTLSPVTGS
ncbi:MAG: group II intron reverse transcriptase/maturase [Planctomycetota bacterium]